MTLVEPEAWRETREPGWYLDLGYLFQDILNSHRYDYRRKGSKPDSPGWHECSCGWEGYWTSFNPHVANHLRAAALDPEGYRETEKRAREARREAAEEF